MSDSAFRRLPHFTLVFVGLLTISFFLFAHEGLYDDYAYARYAHELATVTFDFAPHGVLWITAHFTSVSWFLDR